VGKDHVQASKHITTALAIPHNQVLVSGQTS
jgi:hypothetical protein